MVSKASFFLVAIAVLALGAAPAHAQNVQFAGYPEGPGMDILRTKCRVCHMPDRVKQKGREKDAWDALVHNMMDRGADISDVELPVLVDYLTKNWPPGNADEAAPVAVTAVRPMANQVTVNFKEWTVPTPNSHPHDPLAASDGSIWYTGQRANLLGRIDPKTGDIKEFKLKTPESGPHGLTEDKNGNIWYTGNLKAHIGKLNPKTGEITEYPMPDPAARDPHTAVFDQKGTLWFTLQGANMIGRFNPSNGDLALRNSPTSQSLPYGIAMSSKGVPFYVEFGANKVASIDPDKMVIREWTLPNAEARPRRLAVDANDVIWYSDYARGYLGRLDPKTGDVKEWASPGGTSSRPYGIAVINGDVWYSESGVMPNTLIRFEPGTERFQVWNIPSGGGVVRNVSVTRDGNLALAESGMNKVALVEISR
jgi:virginiamycin B lyase